jgi:phage shock protein PspC (stress-responsive transcriptional regulator)
MDIKNLSTGIFSHVAMNTIYSGVGAGIANYTTVNRKDTNRNMVLGALGGIATGHVANFGLTKFRDAGVKVLKK